MTRPPSRESGRCPTCGKKVYGNRRAARRAAKRLYPADRMHAYRCPTKGPWEANRWHIGHLNLADRDRDRRMRTRNEGHDDD
ncbi:hypothetical protein SAMN05421805_104205 [Saccharopolyspora antimicrobica]|uniref:Uncharacterized protein n=1 Tax=Saccharopolyspora antimicrobica TaxID=455193 RepID=A0A1I4YM01_9PSEU|nr:hypothetical protein ATL45_0989 [Saccharopolyspora antimicrobica]SFN39078.1 hypothetical protein SAMN05421805_104205 [Saccharopolyspora antimicrobica]